MLVFQSPRSGKIVSNNLEEKIVVDDDIVSIP